MTAKQVKISTEYEPTSKEEFMNDKMLAYFKQKLLDWRRELVRESSETLISMQDDGGMQEPDSVDRASAETDRFHLLRTRDRERKLLNKIDQALKRIEDGSYGYCEVTGDPIGVERLKARPIATMSLEAQEMHERKEKVYRDE